MTINNKLHLMDEIRAKNAEAFATCARPQRLAKYRRAAGLSQSQLATLSGVNLRTLQKLESGERAIGRAQLDIVLALARALGVTVEELAGD